MIPFNPDIANAFFRAGLIEAWGRGISKMKNACIKAGDLELEVEIESGGYWLKFTYKETSGVVIPKPAPETLPETLPEMTPETERKIIALFKDNPYLSLREISKIVDLSLSTVKRISKKLQKEGILKRIGPNKGGYWRVIEN